MKMIKKILIDIELKRLLKDDNLDVYLKMLIADNDTIKYVSGLLEHDYPLLSEYFNSANLKSGDPTSPFFDFRVINHNRCYLSDYLFEVFLNIFFSRGLLPIELIDLCTRYNIILLKKI